MTPAITPSISAHAAIDLGASSGRVMLGILSDGGLDLSEMHRFTNEPFLDGDQLHWDINRLFSESMVGLKKAVAECSAAGTTLSSIGIDSWGVDFALVDGGGSILAPIRHHRGAVNPATLINARGLSEASVYELSGVPDQAINTSFQLAKLATEMEFTGERPLFIPDLWVYLLTGNIGTEATIASTSQLMDPSTDDWSRPLVAANGLTGLNFPPISRPGSFAGETSDTITDRIGSVDPIAVYRVASHDTASAFAFAEPTVSAAGHASGGVQGLISSGTWSLVAVAVSEPVKTATARIGHFTNERGASGTLLLRNLNGMWVLQECIRDWERTDGGPVLIQPLLAAAAAAEGSALVFDTADERLLPPGRMIERVQALCREAGRVAPVTRGEVVRAILDSLAAAYAGAFRAAEAVTGSSVTSIRIVGGGSQNALLCQLTADATGLPLLAGPTEASSIGNIAVQAVAAGKRDTVSEIYSSLHGAGTQTKSYLPRGDSLPRRMSPKESHEY
ncbi:rhamnulokinase [Cryobacterium tagatosivorans]|uniref:Rhamnulokinase n=1 Tax=Cryobacterium tagatosivorans TaxID=1259199 RepID=A0A4R8UJY6_9MICO|nr:FGGY-family carbohydrate kinase [Cryobacterium tagatosivorans]TFB55377.1 rhamnulokinase [Cryobacterium tagatosivorans]